MINYSIIFSFDFSFSLISLTQARHNKAISRDTWSQLLEFARVRYKASIHAYWLIVLGCDAHNSFAPACLIGILFNCYLFTQIHMINMIAHVHVMWYLPSPHLLLFSSFLGLCIKINICLQMHSTSERIFTSFC